MSMSEFTRSVLVLRLSRKWIDRGVKKIGKIVLLKSIGGINTELALC